MVECEILSVGSLEERVESLNGREKTTITGAGIVGEVDDNPDAIIIGTGSEVALCVDAAEALKSSGRSVRVVSMPSWDRFRAQPAELRYSILPPGVPTVSVEAGSTFGWHEWSDRQVGIDRFGASAPGDIALDRLGINVDAVVAAVHDVLGVAS